MAEPIRALILSGGGGRGAFHAGVYKYLMELNKLNVDSNHSGGMGATDHCGYIHRRGEWCGDRTGHVCRSIGGSVEIAGGKGYSRAAARDARRRTLGSPNDLRGI